MGRYVLKRLVLMIPVILAVAVLIFSIMYFVPGNPASLIAGSLLTALLVNMSGTNHSGISMAGTALKQSSPTSMAV